ncbi:MAG: hypothetical protein K2V38_29350, partial [Gemmataceae bacterium]|nr:hypothetical protein [Gemmataceae bacterium]
NGTSENKRIIYEFELKPRLTVYAPAGLELKPGQKPLKVPVAVRRQYYKGTIDVKAEQLPDGVTATTLRIPEGKEEGEIELQAAESAKELKKPFKLVASGGGLDSSADLTLAVARPAAEFSAVAVVLIGVWTALLAVGLCLALLAGQNKYLGKSPFDVDRRRLAVVTGGGLLAGFVSGSVGQSLFFLLYSLGAGKLGFLVGWVLLGGLLGRGVSLFIPNLDGRKALIAGVAGGLLGAVAFLILSDVKEWIGRLGGAALLGFCIGLMVAVVEAAFRRAWLEVRLNEREAITVNLGPEPVKIGGDARACTVWARGAADVALRYWVRDGKVFCEDVPTRRESPVSDGDTRGAGPVTVVVHTGSDTAPAPAAPAPAR